MGRAQAEKTGFYFFLDAKIAIANLRFLEYAFSQKQTRL